jgi:hypothetical protein
VVDGYYPSTAGYLVLQQRQLRAHTHMPKLRGCTPQYNATVTVETGKKATAMERFFSYDNKSIIPN